MPKPLGNSCIKVLQWSILFLFITTADAELIDRGGGLIYDTVLDITWLQDPIYGAGSIYDNADYLSTTTDGEMTWFNAMAWVADLSYYDSVRGVTYTDWRLPKAKDVGAPGCQIAIDCGWNIDGSMGEMVSLFYDTLGNNGYYDTSGNHPGGWHWGVENPGPFINLPNKAGIWYWYSLENYNPGSARSFSMRDGLQTNLNKNSAARAWAVRDGDVTAVPVPGAGWLFGFGLIVLGWARRKLAKIRRVSR